MKYFTMHYEVMLLRSENERLRRQIAQQAAVPPPCEINTALGPMQYGATGWLVVSPTDECNRDRLLESQYRAGLRAGWNFGIVDDATGFNATMKGHTWDPAEAKEIYTR